MTIQVATLRSVLRNDLYGRMWRVEEEAFASNQYGPHDSRCIEITNDSNILLTAPHAICHLRDSKIKYPDRGTGGLALLLSEFTGVRCLVETSGVGDPSWDSTHGFKSQILMNPPKLVIDLHGMKTAGDSDLDIGLGNSPGVREEDLLNVLQETFKDSGITVTNGLKFTAQRPTTMTSWAQANDIAAIQLEIGANMRPPQGQDDNLNSFVFSLVSFLQKCKEIY